MNQREPEIDAVTSIGKRWTRVFSSEDEKVSFVTLLRLHKTILADGDSAVHVGLSDVLCRLVEVALIRDPVLERLVLRWNALSVAAPDIVRKRTKELTGTQPDDATVTHLVNILGGSAAQHGRRVAPYEAYLPDLFARRASIHRRKELRCGCCGYHFTALDLNAARQSHAESAGLVLAREVISKRLTDPWKPLEIQVPQGDKLKSRRVTGLTIDHVVPEEGLGWSGAENLDLLCNFCNMGKLAYRWALEPVSMFGAGGFADYPSGRALNKMAQTIVVSALAYSGKRCQACGTDADDAELTVRPIPHTEDGMARGFAPWNLSVVCYSCS
jgi:hypothetical protein